MHSSKHGEHRNWLQELFIGNNTSSIEYGAVPPKLFITECIGIFYNINALIYIMTCSDQIKVFCVPCYIYFVFKQLQVKVKILYSTFL